MEFISFDMVNIYSREFDLNFFKSNDDFTLIPIFGYISCGKFGFIDDCLDGYLEIPNFMLGSREYFVLNAKGDSMTGANIYNGELVIIQKQTFADDGDIAAILHNGEVTLKRFYKLPKEKKYLLHAENDSFEDIVVDNCMILGIAIKVIKNII